MDQQTTTLQNNNLNLDESSETEFELILNTIPDLVIKLNLDGQFIWWNNSFENTIPLDKSNLLSLSFLDAFKPCKGTTLTSVISDTVNNGRCDVDALLATSVGYRRYQLKCVVNNDKEILIVARDIHERMQNIDLVVQSHTQLQKLIDAFPFLIFLTTPNNEYILANKKYCEFFELLQHEIIGFKAEDVFDENISEYFLRDNEKLLTEKTSINYEGRIEFKGRDINLSIDKYPLFDEHGNIYAVCGVAEDITMQHQLQRQLQQTQKMEAIGQLTGGIAHDFNNVLASIMGYTGLMKRTVSKYDDPTTLGYISQINRAGERARDLVQQLLAFSRGDVGGLQILQPSEVTEESMSMLSSLIPSSINLNLDINSNILNRYIEVDPVQFNQSLMNLVINSKDAIVGEKGSIDVKLEYLSDAHGICNSCHMTFSGSYILLSVSDSGEGISQKIMERIFDPFFTTKEVGKGSGMGLSMVHGIVHASGGHIVVKTSKARSKKKGTTIEIYFPEVTPEEIKEESIVYQVQPVENNNEFLGNRILVIDDEPLITSCLTEVLKYEGYEVVSYNSSKGGLSYYKENADEINLIITDQTMPELTGLSLAKNIQDSGFNVPVILCTGYSELAGDSSNEETGVDVFMNKPFQDSDLLDNITKLLTQYSN